MPLRVDIRGFQLKQAAVMQFAFFRPRYLKLLHEKFIVVAMLIFLVFFASNAKAQTAYESSSETAWDLMLKKEDTERFARQLKQAEEFQQDSGTLTGTAKARSLLTTAESIGSETRKDLLQLMNPENTSTEDAVDSMLQPGKTYIFVSQSMPEQLLASLYASFEAGTDGRDINVVFRGLNPDQHTIPDMMRSVWGFIRERGLEPKVNISLNPTIFRELGVRSVPEIVQIQADGKVSRLKGMLNHHFFFSQLDDREGVDLGVQGELFEISERDLIEVIQQRLAAIDWEQKKRNAVNSFWKNYRYEQLPPALEPENIYADMRVFVTKDIPNGSGGFIARKGELLDPFTSIKGLPAFNRRIIVFDPNHPAQVEWAKNQVKTALASNQRPMPMLTNIIGGNDIETLPKMEEQLRSQVFLLVPEVVKRFALTKSPAVVTRSKVKTSSMLVQVYACDSIKMECRSERLPEQELTL